MPTQVGQLDAGRSVVVPGTGPVVVTVVKEPGGTVTTTVPIQVGQLDAGGTVVVPGTVPVVVTVV